MAGFFRSISSGRGSGGKLHVVVFLSYLHYLARAVNLLFYKNEIPSEPDGAFIEDIHAQWKGNYHLLEVHHGYLAFLCVSGIFISVSSYIQWLPTSRAVA